jgi:putative component of toxin-antitoxin plasmid stabilization module
MIEMQKTDEFDVWLSALTDHKAVAKIVTRIERWRLAIRGM